jgi:energy-coupling factor transporter ATP-binding protein EcfA2
MFQNPDYQIFLPTVFEELALGLRAAGIAQDVIRGRVEEAQRLFHLPPGDMPPALMSYGARKRLQAATYNLLGRRLLILDEIDSGLSYREFMSLISALASSGSGLLLITHDAALARAIAHRVIVIDEGRIVQDSPAELFASSPGMPGESR